MASEMDLVVAGGYAIGGTGLASMVFFTIRHFVLRVSKDITTVTVDAGQRDLVNSLREEVVRLEVLVKEMQATINQHTSKIQSLEGEVMRNRSNAAAALALLDVFECECNKGLKEKLVNILKKMAGVDEEPGHKPG